MSQLTCDNLNLHLDIENGELTLGSAGSAERLLISPTFNWMAPVIDDEPIALHFERVETVQTSQKTEQNGWILHFSSELLADFRLQLTVEDGKWLSISSRFTPRRGCVLNRLQLFPRGTHLNLYDVVNFRNRHHTPHVWPELNLGGAGFKTHTYSDDWQFAPHPSLFVIRKAKWNLFVGTLDLPRAFGMSLHVADYCVEQWTLEMGDGEFGISLEANQIFTTPRFCLFLDEDRSVLQTVERYTGLLIEQQLIPSPAVKTRFNWHTAPLYCTWIDQCALSDSKMAAGLDEQSEQSLGSVAKINEQFVRDVLAVIDREKLPFQTILLDDGWQVARGQWEPHPARFPELRKLVDEIHARGLKVIVWWNWAEIFEEVQVDASHLMASGKRNRHGARMRDYSNPKTQKEYLEPLFHQLFSSDEGCYDLDGVKTDFLADKVHADMPVFDAAWFGEENYFFRVYELFFGLMWRFKADACHIGCAGHPYLAQFIDINRTYDIASSDVREHLNRASMLQATTPGTPVAFDFHNYLENFEHYFEVAKAHDFSVQIGNILRVKRDRFSAWETPDTKFYQLLRQSLSSQS